MEPGEYERTARLQAAHWWFAGMRASARQLTASLPLPREARVLDAGCGAGGALPWLAELGTAIGVDWHPLALEFASHLSRRLARGSVEALPFPEESFDLVTCLDVIYHQAVSDDAAALGEIARVLRPGGWLLLRVPAHNWLRGSHDAAVHTRRRYSAGELRAKLLLAGLLPRRLTPLGALLLPAAVIRRGLQARPQAQTDLRLPPPALNTLLTGLFELEARWLRRGNLPFGLSLAALAQKPPAPLN